MWQGLQTLELGDIGKQPINEVNKTIAMLSLTPDLFLVYVASPRDENTTSVICEFLYTFKHKYILNSIRDTLRKNTATSESQTRHICEYSDTNKRI